MYKPSPAPVQYCLIYCIGHNYNSGYVFPIAGNIQACPDVFNTLLTQYNIISYKSIEYYSIVCHDQSSRWFLSSVFKISVLACI